MSSFLFLTRKTMPSNLGRQVEQYRVVPTCLCRHCHISSRHNHSRHAAAEYEDIVGGKQTRYLLYYDPSMFIKVIILLTPVIIYHVFTKLSRCLKIVCLGCVTFSPYTE